MFFFNSERVCNVKGGSCFVNCNRVTHSCAFVVQLFVVQLNCSRCFSYPIGLKPNVKVSDVTKSCGDVVKKVQRFVY